MQLTASSGVRSRISPTFAALLLLVGCWGRGIEYEGGTNASTGTGDGGDGGDGGTNPTTAPPPVECGDDADTTTGYRVEGTVSDLETAELLWDGLCVWAIDPTPAVTGGDPLFLSSAEVCDGGEYLIPNIEEVPTIGMFVMVDDCDNDASDTVMKAATGLSPDEITGLGDGDAVFDHVAEAVSQEYLTLLDSELGVADSLGVTGFLAGYVVDSSESPVGGAAISCGGCADVYYLDSDPSDGLFMTGGSINTETDASAGSFFIIPDAPVFTYEADDGGAHTWAPSLFGSIDEYGVFVNFVAD